LIITLFGAQFSKVLAQADSLSSGYVFQDSSSIDKPRVVYAKDLLGETMFYSAKDSIVADIKGKKLYLYNEGKIQYGSTTLTANYMVVDLDKKEVYATYSLDSLGKRQGEVVFQDGADEVRAAGMRFNFETKKAIIEETRIKQDESFLFMGIAKRQANEEIHFCNGRFSTCDLEQPHFHFNLTEAVLVPNERIVAGPSNLWVNGVPTPLVLPFAYFPTKNQPKTGLMFPEIIPASPNGLGLQNLGYYFPINDKLNTTVFATIYSRGSFGFSNQSEYNVRYKFNGNLRLSYENFSRGFPDTTRRQKIGINWTHNQDPKANPYWRFMGSVNFQSDNNPQVTLNPQSQNVFNNATQSNITLNRNFPGKPYTMGIRMSVNQNSVSRNMTADLPTFNFNMSRVQPFKALRKKDAIGPEKWFEKIGLTYSGEFKNTATFGDSLITKEYRNLLPDRFLNGMNHQFNLTSNVQLLGGNLNVVPNVSYQTFMNFQSVTPNWNNATQSTQLDSTSGFFIGQNMNFRLSATTTVYSMFQLIGAKNVRFRNVTRPSLGYAFVPVLNQVNTTFTDAGQAVRYTIHDRSLYRSASTREQSLINFGLTHVTDMKMPSKRDSTGFKKINIIEGLSLNGSYDMLRDSFKLSDLNTQLRIKPLEFWNIVAGGNFSLYDWDTISQRSINSFAMSRAGDRQLGRWTTFNVASTFTFSSKEGQKIISETDQILKENWNQDYNYYMLRPYEVMDFRIPWRVNLSYNFDWRRNVNLIPNQENQERSFIIQTITYQADFTLTPRWMVSTRGTFDIKQQKFSTVSLDVHRNLHCWKLSFFWVPVGFNKSFMVRIAANASMLKDVKYEFRRPPAFF
jgi:hypothetical protein